MFKISTQRIQPRNKNNPKKRRRNKQTNDERETIEKYDLCNNCRMLVAVRDFQPDSFKWSSSYALQSYIHFKWAQTIKQWAQTTYKQLIKKLRTSSCFAVKEWYDQWLVTILTHLSNYINALLGHTIITFMSKRKQKEEQKKKK